MILTKRVETVPACQVLFSTEVCPDNTCSSWQDFRGIANCIAFCPRAVNGAAVDTLLTGMTVMDYYSGFTFQTELSRMLSKSVCVFPCILLSCWHTMLVEVRRWAARFHLPLVCILSLAADTRKLQRHISIQM